MVLKSKKVLVTGASDGIGRQVALKLAEAGAELVILGRSESRLDELAEKIKSKNSINPAVYAFDIADRGSMTDHLEQIRVEHQDLCAVVNCAGVWQKLGDLDSLNHDEIEDIINTNLTGLIKITNTLLPVLRNKPEAAIINVSSKSGVAAQKGQSVYSASKYGVRGFTEVLKEDLKDTNIRVAGVYQSGTNTSMFEKAGDDMLIEKFTDPADLADVIVFMLSRPAKIWLNEVRVNY